MDKLSKYVTKLKKWNEAAIEKELLKIIRQNKQEVIDLNISQMLHGIDSKGKKITPKYSKLTVIIKKKKGQPYDVVTLRDKGLFQGEMYVDAAGFPVSIFSRNSKTKKLVDKYGEAIFGLTKANQDELIKVRLKDQIQDLFNKILSI